MAELAIEFEAKAERMLPGHGNVRPAATVDQIRTAEVLHGAPLTPELLALAELHNGWDLPHGHSIEPLIRNTTELQLWPNLFPRSGGPFEERKSVIFAGKPGEHYLITPLAGDYRGHVFRMSIDGYYSCYAAGSISEILASWIYYLDNGYLVPSPGAHVLVPTGSKLDVEEGIEAFSVLFGAWPYANPLSLEQRPDTNEPAEVAFTSARQAPYGIDPRLDPRHPEHFLWCDETLEGLEQQEASMLLDYRTQLT